MKIPVSIRSAVCAIALTFAAATIASAQVAAGADGNSAPTQPGQTNSSSANSASLPAAANTAQPTPANTYEPITGEQRLWWAFIGTVGPKSLLIAGPFSAGIGTALNHPHEYGTHWDGFGSRYGMRLTGVATSNLMEVGIGALWGEDPRYQRQPDRSFGGRVWSVIEQDFIAKRTDGRFHPAYARYMAITGSNFLSNAWRVDSEADTAHALGRTGYGFLGRLAGNAWDEFWPSVHDHFHH